MGTKSGKDDTGKSLKRPVQRVIHCASQDAQSGRGVTPCAFTEEPGAWPDDPPRVIPAHIPPPVTGQSKRFLEVFCGRGGWSKAFAARGWHCTGVDLLDLGYPGELIKADVRDLDPDWIDGFDALAASPPFEEFARAWLPWLRGDHQPAQSAINLLKWSIRLCTRPRRIVECSNFAAKHAPGAIRCGSFSLWGDVPLLLPQLTRGKMRITGKRPDLRAEIPPELAAAVADHFGPGFAAIAMPPGYRLRQLCGVFQYIAPDGVASILFPKITQAAASAQFHANLAQCIARHNSTEAAR